MKDISRQMIQFSRAARKRERERETNDDATSTMTKNTTKSTTGAISTECGSLRLGYPSYDQEMDKNLAAVVQSEGKLLLSCPELPARQPEQASAYKGAREVRESQANSDGEFKFGSLLAAPSLSHSTCRSLLSAAPPLRAYDSPTRRPFEQQSALAT